MPKKGQQNVVKSQKRPTKFSEILKMLTKLIESQKANEIKSWIESLSHDFIQIKILESFFESWVDLNQNILKAFWVTSLFESNFRNPFWIVSLFESILLKAIVSQELSRIKTFWDWVESNKKMSRTRAWFGHFRNSETEDSDRHL